MILSMAPALLISLKLAMSTNRLNFHSKWCRRIFDNLSGNLSPRNGLGLEPKITASAFALASLHPGASCNQVMWGSTCLFPLPSSSLPFFPSHVFSSFLPIPSLSFPLEAGPLIAARRSGDRFSSPSGSWRNLAAKRNFVNLRLKISSNDRQELFRKWNIKLDWVAK